MARCALVNIETRKVENVLIADPEKDTPAPGYLCVDIGNSNVNNGDVYIGGGFQRPIPLVKVKPRGLVAPKLGERSPYTLDTPLADILSDGHGRAKALWYARGNHGMATQVATCPALLWANRVAQPGDTLRDFVQRIVDGLKSGEVQPQWVHDFLTIEGPVLPEMVVDDIIQALPIGHRLHASCCAEAQD